MRLQLPINGKVAFVAATIATLAGTAMAQQKPSIPEVQVQASGVITKELGRTPEGTRIASSVTMRVSYADLSLNTNSGQALFRARVTDAAKEACKRASADYPLSTQETTDFDCVKVAVKGAMPRVDSIIAAANAPRNATPQFTPQAQPQAQPAR